MEVADAGAGSRYVFSVDGGAFRPDPRSPFQPEGVDGPSEVVDHAAFPWTDLPWRGLPLPGAVLYEMHVGTFTRAGTFDAAVEKLDHLVQLGIDAVELLPVAEFAGSRGWGYDGVALFAPHHAYGGPDALKRLVDACHARGLGVVMDVVYNHVGPAGNYLAEFGPYFTGRYRTNWGDAINFDGPDSTEVRRFVIDNALMWLRDYHCDGLRLDAVHAIVDQSALHILEEIGREVEAASCHLARPVFVIAECDLNDPRMVQSRDGGGFGLDAAWADEWHHALHAALTGERGGYYSDFGSLRLLAKALRQAWVYDGKYSEYRKRVHGRAPTGLRGHQFVISVQNHDQVGNRALGERLSALTSGSRLKVAAALMLTGPFTPMLFQGEEWAASTPFQYFTDHAPDLGRAVSEGRRAEFAGFGWDPARIPDPQVRSTFERSKLDWSEVLRPFHSEMLGWYRALLALRRRVPALGDPRLERTDVTFDETAGWLLVRRADYLVAANLGAGAASIAIAQPATLVLSSSPSIRLGEGGLNLPADSVAVVQVEYLTAAGRITGQLGVEASEGGR
jgi:maltooligosyltrehalose trehalohydrolase